MIPCAGKQIRVAVRPTLTVGDLARHLAERLELPRINPEVRTGYSYKIYDPRANGVAIDPNTPIDQLKLDVDSEAALILEQLRQPFQLSLSRKAVATFAMSDDWSVDGLQGFLRALSDLYRSLYAQDQWLADPNRSDHRYHSIADVHEEIASSMRPDEVLLLKSISINSPGLIEVIGALNPLDTIRRILNDHRQAKIAADSARREQKKDDAYRNAVEQAKHVLELESMKTRVAKERAEMLRDAGLSQNEIRPYIDKVLTPPISHLLVFQEQNSLKCTDVLELDASDIEIVDDGEGGVRGLLGLPQRKNLDDI